MMETVVGITGHRFLAERDKIVAGVDRALARIQQALPSGTMTVLSLLAEGADQLVVERALRRCPSRLVAVLPLPAADYVPDLTASAGQAFLAFLDRADEIIQLPPCATRDQAYVAGGRWILEHCQVLVAVWDGEPAQGEGGTGDIVAEARERGLPLAWVRAGNRRSGTQEPTTLGALQGKVTYERFSSIPGTYRGERRLSGS